MATTVEELDDFNAFVRQRLASRGADFSLDELFDLWRSQNPSGAPYAENVSAVNAAIRDYRNGDRGTLAGGHSDQLRHQFGRKTE